MILYGLKTCDTCRKARKALPDAEFKDVRADGVPSDILARAHDEFGDRLINKSSTTWRQMDEATRALPALELLKTNPTVMKRPLIEADGQLYLGWGKDVQEQLTI